MHILHITGTYTPSVNGVALVVESLKNELESLGHTVTVLAPDNPHKKKEEGVIRYPSFPNPIDKDYPVPLIPGLKSLIKLLKDDAPDIVHVHHPFHIGYMAKLIAHHYKVPLIFTFHSYIDAFAEKYAQFLPTEMKKKFMTYSFTSFCKECDIVVCPSQFIKDKLLDENQITNTVVIPAPINGFQKVIGSKNELRSVLNLPQDKMLLLTVGRLAPEKDINLLIESLCYLPKKYVLVIVGEGSEREKLQNLAQKLKVEKKVIFVGRVGHADIWSYYVASDYFYFASTAETQGLVYLEAAKAALPIVAADFPVAREWVKKEFGIITAASAKNLANAVRRIGKRNYATLQKSSLQFSRAYTTGKLIKRLVNLYEATNK